MSESFGESKRGFSLSVFFALHTLLLWGGVAGL